MNSKAQKRQALLEKRRQLEPQFVLDASREVARRLFSLDEFLLAERMGLYAAFKNEVETASIFQKAHGMRKELFYPAVDSQREAISFYRVRHLEDLSPGYCGILEPEKRHSLTNINYLNCILIPGVAFDLRGNRLGLGKGYYDRLLSGFKGKRLALAYDFQIVDWLPSSARDERVDILVTEERVLRIT